MALPQLTDEQRKAALEKAAAARHARAELREKIKKGEVSLDSVLNSEDPIASRMKVSGLHPHRVPPRLRQGQGCQDHGRAGHLRHASRPGPRRPSARAAARGSHQVSEPFDV